MLPVSNNVNEMMVMVLDFCLRVLLCESGTMLSNPVHRVMPSRVSFAFQWAWKSLLSWPRLWKATLVSLASLMFRPALHSSIGSNERPLCQETPEPTWCSSYQWGFDLWLCWRWKARCVWLYSLTSITGSRTDQATMTLSPGVWERVPGPER